MVEEGVIAPHDLDLIHWSEDADEAWDFVTPLLRRASPPAAGADRAAGMSGGEA